MDVVKQKNTAAELRDQGVVIYGLVVAPCFRYGVFQPFQNTLLVAFGLEFSYKPGPGVCQSLIVDVDRVLCRQYAAESKSPGLFEHGHERSFGRGFCDRREKAEYLVEIQ